MWWLISCLLLGGAVAGNAAFEITGGGARTAGLGGAFTAGADDAEAVWFNPAAGGRAQGLRANTTHALLYPGLDDALNLSALAATIQVGRGGVQTGLSLLDFTDWREQVGVVGYGRELHARLAVGGSLRSSSWKTEGLSHRSWSADLGGIYEVGWIHPQVYARLGVVASNINGANVSANGHTAGETSRGLIIAAAFTVEQQEILIDVERRGGQMEMRLGYETRSPSLYGAKFRMGMNSFSADWKVGELNAGIGHNWGPWQFDYAYTYPLQLTDLGGVHRFGLSYHRR